MKLSPPPFRGCVSARLGRIKRLVSSTYRQHLIGTGLTESQLSIVLALAGMGSIEQIELARRLVLDKSSMSRNLVRLTNMGLLQKSEHYHPTLSLTPKGQTLARNIQPVWQQAMDEVSAKLGPEGLQALALLESKL